MIAPRKVNAPVLKNVTFSIAQGSMMAMYGGTGSGKTTLLQSMLGEAEILDGSVYIDESSMSVALCGQITWLPNVSVRDCVIGACEFDRLWFDTVIDRCRLAEDLRELPDGEDYVIGSDGAKLSGGQRQRIGIARSVYARTKAVIFDDAFSALDEKTATGILFGLCGDEGLLRRDNRTVVVSSYLSQCLEVADAVILLDNNGAVSCEPCRNNRRLREQVALLLGPDSHTRAARPASRDQAPGNSHVRHVAGCSAVSHLESDSRRKGDADLYFLCIDAIGRRRMVPWLLLMVFMAFAETVPPIFVKMWIEVAPTDRLWLLGYALLSLSSGVLAVACLCSIFIVLSPRASVGLHKRLTDTVTQSTLGFLSTTDTGSIVNRYGLDMELLASRVPAGVYNFLYCGFTTLIQVGIILSGATYMTAVLPFVLGSLYFIQRYYLRTSRQLRLLEIEAQAPLVTELRELSTGVIYIRGFGWQEHSLARCLRLLDASQRPFYFLLCSQTLLALVLDLLATLIATTLVTICLYVEDASSPNATGLAFLSLLMVGTSFNRLVTDWTSMETAVGSLARLQHFLTHTPIENNKGEVELSPEWPFEGRVQWENVSARYRVDDQDRQVPVLHDLCFTIEPGQKIGVMGRTGSGKSSLLATLLGFLEYSGTVKIDGIDIATAEPDQLRSRIITISQELVELDGSIRDNMIPYNTSWDNRVNGTMGEKEAEEARRTDEIIRETMVRLLIWDQAICKGGLDAPLDTIGYSHGELQLLCIARAVVRRRLSGSSLLLVDEATASVDDARDQIVREMMREYFRGCTIIVVAHREGTIADSNVTLHMSGGRIERLEEYW